MEPYRFYLLSLQNHIGAAVYLDARDDADALGYLELTIEGKQWIANLFSHVFTIEHARRRLGPRLVPKGSERS